MWCAYVCAIIEYLVLHNFTLVQIKSIAIIDNNHLKNLQIGNTQPKRNSFILIIITIPSIVRSIDLSNRLIIQPFFRVFFLCFWSTKKKQQHENLMFL